MLAETVGYPEQTIISSSNHPDILRHLLEGTAIVSQETDEVAPEALTRRYSDAIDRTFRKPIEEQRKRKESSPIRWMMPGADPHVTSFIDGSGNKQFLLTLSSYMAPNLVNRTTFYQNGQIKRENTDPSPGFTIVSFQADSIEGLSEDPDPQVILSVNDKTAFKSQYKGEELVFKNAVWAPERVKIGDAWYLYVAAEAGEFPQYNHRHRPVVYKSNSANGPYGPAGLVSDGFWGIDLSITTMPKVENPQKPEDQELIAVWSGWMNHRDGAQCIKGARMSDPTKISGPSRIISAPIHPNSYAKDCQLAVREGPQFVHDSKGKYVGLKHTRGVSWRDGHDGYCEWMQKFIGKPGDDVLNPMLYDQAVPLFQIPRGVGHGMFVDKSYIGHGLKESGWEGRWVLQIPYSENSDRLPMLDYDDKDFARHKLHCMVPGYLGMA